MTDLRQAAHQALEALEDERYVTKYTHIVAAITSLRKALEQPEQQAEPCIGKDPRCPCQDGDACHYKDCGNTKARPVAQPEQEPAAWAVQGCSKMWRDEFAEIDAKAEAKRIGGTCVAYALYTTPPAAQRPWVGLTEEEMSDAVAGMEVDFGDLLWKVMCLTKLIEAKLKERNT
jgi:hypothetical protein